jgi:IS4 transposase
VDCDEPVDWYLLTTLPLTTFDRVIDIVRYYGFRWRIEDWHRVIKHCCNIEKAQNATAERIGRSIAIKLIIGWRIMVMTLLARETPNLSPEVIFTKSELHVLSLVQRGKKKDLR